MKKILYFLLVTFMTMTTACSSDDGPENDNPNYDGQKIYQTAVTEFYGNDGKPYYTPTNTDGVYVASASNREVSYNFICHLIDNSKWDGKDLTVNLGKSGEKGSLKIIGESSSLLQQGIYNKIIIDIADYNPYTLEIITEEQAENGYIGDGVVKKLR